MSELPKLQSTDITIVNSPNERDGETGSWLGEWNTCHASPSCKALLLYGFFHHGTYSTELFNKLGAPMPIYDFRGSNLLFWFETYQLPWFQHRNTINTFLPSGTQISVLYLMQEMRW